MERNDNRVLAFGVLAIAALLLSIIAAGAGTVWLDRTLIQAAQSVESGALADGTWLLSRLGDTPVAVAIGGCAVIVLAWMHRLVESAIVLAGLAVRVANPFLKELFESPRPDGASAEVSQVLSDYGFPSGHSMGALLLYGSLIYVAQRIGPFRGRRLLQAGAALMILGTGFSRVYGGVHWTTDVLGGYLWGSLLLLAAIGFVEWGVAAHRRRAGRNEGLLAQPMQGWSPPPVRGRS